MKRQLSIPVGVVVERTAVESIWQSHAWRPAGLIIGETALETGSVLRQNGASTSFFAGSTTLELHPSDAESYRNNLSQDVPRLYVVLAAPEEMSGSAPAVHLVTAAPDEAESYVADGDGGIVDGIPMEKAMIDLVTAYVTAHTTPPREEKRRFRVQPDPADNTRMEYHRGRE